MLASFLAIVAGLAFAANSGGKHEKTIKAHSDFLLHNVFLGGCIILVCFSAL